MSARDRRPDPGPVLQSEPFRSEPSQSEAAFVPRFGVEVRTQQQVTVLALTGELDHDSAPLLRERFDEVFDAAATRRQAAPGSPAGPSSSGIVVVDCADLGFCDSTGLNVLLTARLRAEEVGLGIRLAALRGHVVRMFEVTGVGGVFSIHPDLADALAAG
jgi:anti-anti-sigma regulatory factor